MGATDEKVRTSVGETIEAIFNESSALIYDLVAFIRESLNFPAPFAVGLSSLSLL